MAGPFNNKQALYFFTCYTRRIFSGFYGPKQNNYAPGALIIFLKNGLIFLHVRHRTCCATDHVQAVNGK